MDSTSHTRGVHVPRRSSLMLTTESGGHLAIEAQGVGNTEEITIVNKKEARGINTTEEFPIAKENET